MVKITFAQLDGVEQIIEGTIGLSVMQAAVAEDVQGILAECGGACACATCHVVVDPVWAGSLSAMEDSEKMMLDGAKHVTEYSRLSCQIIISEELDGLKLTVPESQI